MELILDQSLVLNLPLYEPDGELIASKDSRGHLCAVTGAQWRLQGRSFDGSDDYIDCGNPPAFTMNEAFTYEAWFKPDSVSAYRIILALGAGGLTKNTGDVRFSGGNLYTYWHGSGGVTCSAMIPGIQAGCWYHLAVVLPSNGFPRLLLDGTKEGTTSGTPQVFAGTGWKAWIGRTLYGDSAQNFDGTIREVRLYSRALSVSEIRRNYLATAWRYR
jgi:hypothetical protein